MRRSFTLCSVGVHTIVITAAFYAQILGDSSLPTPHRPLIFDASSIMPVEVQLPKPRAIPPATTREAISANAAPVMAPTGVAPETARNLEPSPDPDGSTAGGDAGPPSSKVEGPGITSAPPPPPASPLAPIRLHSGMTAPVKTVHVAPVYPAIAQTARVQGVVILEALLDAKGRVEAVRVLRSIPLLDRAAVEAVQQWRFTPALLNNEAVPVVMTVTVNFELRE